MPTEIWKDIDGYVGQYQVSNYGRVRSLDRDIVIRSCSNYTRHVKGRILALTKDKDGYLIVGLGKERRRVSRIVAQAFIDNPKNYEQVNHINGIKEDNSVWNLEWCTNTYNQEHAYLIGLKKTKLYAKVDPHSKRIVQIYKSLNEAVENTDNSDPSTLVKVCRNKRNEHCGFKWIYATDKMKVGDVID